MAEDRPLEEQIPDDAGGLACGLGPRPTTLYNGACPVCGPEVRRYQRIDARGSGDLGWRDISQDPAILEALGLKLEDVKERLHVVDDAGAIHIGVDAFAVLWAELPGHRWLSTMIRLPVVHPMARFVYDRALAPTLYRWNRYRDRRRDGTAGSAAGRG